MISQSRLPIAVLLLACAHASEDVALSGTCPDDLTLLQGRLSSRWAATAQEPKTPKMDPPALIGDGNLATDSRVFWHGLQQERFPTRWIVGVLALASITWFISASLSNCDVPESPEQIVAASTEKVSGQRAGVIAAVSWALGACMCFGVTHWFTEILQYQQVTAWIGEDVSRHSIIDIMCAASGLFASAANYFMLRRGDYGLKAEYNKLVALLSGEAGSTAKLCSVLAVGPMHYTALSVQRAFLERSIANAGPLMAIVSTDVVPLTILVACCFGETVPAIMMAGMTCIVVCNLVIGFSVGTLADDAVSVFLSLTAMLLFAAAAFCLRLSARHGFSTACTFIVRCQMLVVSAAVGCLLDPSASEVNVPFVVSGMVLAAIHDIGIYCITASLSYPFAGPVCAIWGSNATVVFFLNWIVLHELPSMYLMLGMTGTILGVWMCAMAG